MFNKGLQAILSFARSRRIPPRGIHSIVGTLATPPDGTSPAVVAKLTGHTSAVPATLFDLARRLVVRIEATPGARPESKKFILYRQATVPNELSLYEQGLLEAILQTRDSVALSTIAPRLAWEADKLDEALEVEMATAGWLNPQHQRQRSQRLAFSVNAALLGAAVVLAGLVLGGAALGGFLAAGFKQASVILTALLIGGGVAALAASLMALCLAARLSPLSEQGQLAAAQWKRFAAYLQEVIQGHAPQPPQEHFDLYLPLAAAFGLAEAWARHFQRQSGTPLPAWLQSLTATADAGDFGATAALLTAAGFASGIGEDHSGGTLEAG